MDRITNVEVLRRMDKKIEVMPSIKIRKLSYLEHIMRNSLRSMMLIEDREEKEPETVGMGRLQSSYSMLLSINL